MKIEIKRPIRLSPSSIISYHRCPREFYYRYLVRLPTPPAVPLVKGKLVHRILELLFQGEYEPNLEKRCEELYHISLNEEVAKGPTLQEEWDSLKLPPEESEKELRDAMNMVRLFLHTFRLKMDVLKDVGRAKGDRHAYYMLRPKLREKWYEDKELNLCGYVDRIHTDFNGELTIGDYKTSSRYGIGIKDEYEMQCGLYALLYYRLEGKLPDYTSIIYLRYGEEVITRCTPAQISLAIERVKYVRENTESDDIEKYPMKEGKLCKFCPYAGLCSGKADLEGEIRRKKALAELDKSSKKDSGDSEGSTNQD